MKRCNRSGFTLVEAAIVVVVIVVILAVTIPWMRERERARLQALADTEPWEVFEFQAMTARDSYTIIEYIVIQCEIENLTNYPLTLPDDLVNGRGFLLTDTGVAVGRTGDLLPMQLLSTDINGTKGLSHSIPATTIGAQESIKFEFRMLPLATGTAECRVTLCNESQTEAFMERIVFGRLAGDENRLQSNAIQLTVDEIAGANAPTFDDVLAGIEHLNRLVPNYVPGPGSP